MDFPNCPIKECQATTMSAILRAEWELANGEGHGRTQREWLAVCEQKHEFVVMEDDLGHLVAMQIKDGFAFGECTVCGIYIETKYADIDHTTVQEDMIHEGQSHAQVMA